MRLNGGSYKTGCGFWAEQLQLWFEFIDLQDPTVCLSLLPLPRRKRDWRVDMSGKKSHDYVAKGNRKLTKSLRGCEEGR